MTERKVLVVGAGSAGKMAVSEMLRVPGAGFVPVAFIDDDPDKQGTEIEGIRVLGRREDIPEALVTTGANEIIIALPSVHGGVIRDIVATCRSTNDRRSSTTSTCSNRDVNAAIRSSASGYVIPNLSTGIDPVSRRSDIACITY